MDRRTNGRMWPHKALLFYFIIQLTTKPLHLRIQLGNSAVVTVTNHQPIPSTDNICCRTPKRRNLFFERHVLLRNGYRSSFLRVKRLNLEAGFSRAPGAEIHISGPVPPLSYMLSWWVHLRPPLPSTWTKHPSSRDFYRRASIMLSLMFCIYCSNFSN